MRKISVNDDGFFRDVILYAFRYALGRQSYAPSVFTDFALDNLELISDIDVDLMIREILEAESMGYMSDIDRIGWVSFSEKINKLKDNK